jgi:hypothetical protein
MEVASHFVANDDLNGLDLIRLEWGYMLNSPSGTNSTFWEGYLVDGSFDQGSYMSAAHGWATGPTWALTYFVLGIGPEVASGLNYRFVPHPGDLKWVAGRLTLPVGQITASWQRDTATATFTESVSAPEVASGRIGVPTFGQKAVVLLDGIPIWDGCDADTRLIAPTLIDSVSSDGSYIYLIGVKGSHTLTERSPCGS